MCIAVRIAAMIPIHALAALVHEEQDTPFALCSLGGRIDPNVSLAEMARDQQFGNVSASKQSQNLLSLEIDQYIR